MINAPLYSLGDSLTLTGSNEQGYTDEYSYSYQENQSDTSDYVSVYETYVYWEPPGDKYIESYTYSSADGATINGVLSSIRNTEYDDIQRVTSDSQLVNNEYQSPLSNGGYSEIGSEGYTLTTYEYANDTGYELSSSFTEYSYASYDSSGYYYSYWSITDSTYSYNRIPTSVDDFYQRRDTTITDDDGDGITDYTTYSLTTLESKETKLAIVQYDSSGTQTSSSIRSTEREIDGSITSSSYDYFNSFDYDEDGITDSTNEYSQDVQYDSSSIIINEESTQIDRADSDGDGSADYVYIASIEKNQNSGRRITVMWIDDAGPATLSLGISKDTDGDGSYDVNRSFDFAFFRLPASWTDMGDHHVATLDDTLMA